MRHLTVRPTNLTERELQAFLDKRQSRLDDYCETTEK